MSLSQGRGPSLPVRECLAVTYRRAAQALDVSERTVRRMVDRGELEGERLMGCPRVTVTSLMRRMGEEPGAAQPAIPRDDEAEATARDIERRLDARRV